MGTFLGHVVPGSFFCVFALWWLYNVLQRYFYSRKFKPNSYRNSCSFPSSCSKRVPIESTLKVVAVILGIIGEFYTAFENGKFTHWGNAQHITMFFFFGVNGVIDLLLQKRWALPPNLDYVSAAMAFGVEGFLFYNHLHGRTHMDIQVHMYLFYLTVACVLSTVLEMVHPGNVMPALSRTFFTLLQGTWFFQAGFVLYPPFGTEKWDEDDHTQIMIVTMIFTWHIAAVWVFMMCVGVVIWFRVKNYLGSLPMYQMVSNGTNELPFNKNVYEDGGGTQRDLTNGHVHFDKSDSSIQNILDSDSEEA